MDCTLWPDHNMLPSRKRCRTADLVTPGADSIFNVIQPQKYEDNIQYAFATIIDQQQNVPALSTLISNDNQNLNIADNISESFRSDSRPLDDWFQVLLLRQRDAMQEMIRKQEQQRIKWAARAMEQVVQRSEEEVQRHKRRGALLERAACSLHNDAWLWRLQARKSALLALTLKHQLLQLVQNKSPVTKRRRPLINILDHSNNDLISNNDKAITPNYSSDRQLEVINHHGHINNMNTNYPSPCPQYVEEGYGDSEEISRCMINPNFHNVGAHDATKNGNVEEEQQKQRIDAGGGRMEHHTQVDAGVANAELRCGECRGEGGCMLLFLPCRHLHGLLCRKCEGHFLTCPTCHDVKDAAVQVYL